MNTSKIRIFALAFLSLTTLSGCAPKLGLRLATPDVSLEDREDKTPNKVARGDYSGVKVKVVPFLDARSSDTLAIIDGREVLSEGDLGPSVQTGFERQLRDAGGRIALLQAPTMEGEVIDWRAKVTPDFPASGVTAKAKIRVSVRDKKNKEIYRAVYSGEANKQHPFLDEDDVRANLGFAMASAIEAALADEGLLDSLRSAQQR